MAYTRALMLAAILGAFVLAQPGTAKAEAYTFPVITGENWTNATPQERLSFIAGMTTMIELEKEVQGANPPADQKSLVPGWVSGLSRFTLKEIVEALDKVFVEKPELKAKPVVEVLWYEVAFPKTDKK